MRRATSVTILRTYVNLTVLSTFASSFIWGINTLFLLDAGLSVTQAFAANAFFTLGELLFEVPTGVVADMYGRRTSYLLGAATLFASTILYLAMWRFHWPFWGWALSSMLLGLGFTFFSGATEAWLVDALHATAYQGTLDAAFAKGQVAQGVGMLVGTIGGGVIAQFTNLGVPYLLRAGALLLTFIVAFVFMHDVGFHPRKSAGVIRDARNVLRASVEYGFKNRPVRWVMLSGLVAGGVPIFGFYAMQPYLLELRNAKGAYAIASTAAALVATAQIAGGYLAPLTSQVFRRRTSALLLICFLGSVCLAAIGIFPHFWPVLVLLTAWGVVLAVAVPVRLGYLNGLLPSAQRATILSFDNLQTSAAGAVTQPVLGRVADISGYAASFAAGAAISILAMPFLYLAKRNRASSDRFPTTAQP